MFGCDLVEPQRAAVEEHDGERLGRPDRGPDRRQQLLLLARQVEHRAGLGLAAHLARLAQGEHDLVGRLGGVDGRREARVGGALVGGVVELVVAERAARRERGVRVLRLHAREQRHRVGVVAAAPPGAEHVVGAVAERPDDRRRLRGVERQHGPVVLEQHRRAGGRLARRRAVLRQQLLALGGADVDVRMLEQPGAELHAQDAADGVVDAAHGHLPARDELLAEVAVVGRDHLRVGAGVERRAWRPRAPFSATPCPHGPAVGASPGQARSSATAV